MRRPLCRSARPTPSKGGHESAISRCLKAVLAPRSKALCAVRAPARYSFFKVSMYPFDSIVVRNNKLTITSLDAARATMVDTV